MKKEPSILGIVTVNDKGQVVIPIEARSLIDVKSGDKLMVMIHPSHEGIVLIKPDGLEKFAKKMLAQVSNAKLSFNSKAIN
ncbi:MAG: AbrB/MazE/SpoVT family DNA-binding domain-containing protein [bacterium]